MHFVAGDRVLMARKMVGSFPDYSRVVPTKFEGKATFSTAELRDALNRAKVFTDERSQAVSLAIKGNAISIRVKESEKGESDEFIPADVAGPDIEIGFNGGYISDFLAAASEADQAAFSYNDSASAGVFTPAGDQAAQLGEYRVVIMPMRI